MAANQPPDDTQDIYFTPHDDVVKVLQKKALDSEKLKQCPEYYNEMSTSSGDDVSISPDKEYYLYDGGNDEYVLPPQKPKSSHPQSDVTVRPTTKREVRDLYDEDHYALPDVEGCVTKEAGVLKNDRVVKQATAPSKIKESKCRGNKWKISGILFMVLVVGGIAGIAITVYTGIVFSFPQWKHI